METSKGKTCGDRQKPKTLNDFRDEIIDERDFSRIVTSVVQLVH